jgi:hypothetical protein
MHAARSYAFVDDAEVQRALAIAPRSVLEGHAPRLLDEWRVAPEPWNLVRRAVDASAVPGRSSGERPAPNMNAGPGLEEVVENILRPGFPAMTALGLDQSADRLRAYVDEVARTDIRRLADVRHEPEVIKQLIAALARSVAREVTHRTSPKLHLVDASLAAAALGAGPEHLQSDLETLGVLFESAVIHDLAVRASRIGGEILHYRDSNGKEIDAVITLADGRWAAVEIKLGGPQMLVGVESLRNAIDQIDTDAVGEPAFRLVVTGTGPILTKDEGTVISPLSALAP